MNTFYSQFGEDKILADFFQGKKQGVCVEIGANDGVHGSTSLFFEKLGWTCILVEPNPALCQEIRQGRNALIFECAASNRPGTATLHIAEGAWRADGMSTISAKQEDHERILKQGFSTRPVQVATRTVDEVLTEARIDGTVDFVTVDVEGHEREVIEGFSLGRWRPTIVIVEDNSNAESQATSEQLAKSGYVRFLRTGVNDWYAHRDNKSLVNARSQVAVTAQILMIRAKNRLRRVPLLRKIRDLLRPRKTLA